MPTGVSKYSRMDSFWSSRSSLRNSFICSFVIVPFFSLARRDSRRIAFSIIVAEGLTGVSSTMRNAPGSSVIRTRSPVAFPYSSATNLSILRMVSYNSASVFIRFGLISAVVDFSSSASSRCNAPRFDISDFSSPDAFTSFNPLASRCCCVSCPVINCSRVDDRTSFVAAPLPIRIIVSGVANVVYGVPGSDRNNDDSTPRVPRTAAASGCTGIFPRSTMDLRNCIEVP